MYKSKKILSIILCITIMSTFFGCATNNSDTGTKEAPTKQQPKVDPYHDARFIGEWDVVSWDGTSKIYYPEYCGTYFFNIDGTYTCFKTEEQYKKEKSFSEAYQNIVYERLSENSIRESFYGMSAKDYEAYLQKIVNNELPAVFQNKNGKTLNAWLDEQYQQYAEWEKTEKAIAENSGFWMTYNDRLIIVTVPEEIELEKGQTLEQYIIDKGYHEHPEISYKIEMSEDGKLFYFYEDGDEDPYYNDYPASFTKIN
ncbi:MAG: hypothetical protein IKK37_06515 [Clostridia bacterium]|nr:hypothetical protein [Clostridia bacterium]